MDATNINVSVSSVGRGGYIAPSVSPTLFSVGLTGLGFRSIAEALKYLNYLEKGKNRPGYPAVWSLECITYQSKTSIVKRQSVNPYPENVGLTFIPPSTVRLWVGIEMKLQVLFCFVLLYV